MLALFAGTGGLPAAVAACLETSPFIFSMTGFPPSGVSPDRTFRIEHMGTMIKSLTDHKVTEICFAGGIARPAIDPSQIDAATMSLVPMMQAAMTAGDDCALRAVLSIFEEAGLTIRGAHDVAPDLLPEPGVLTSVAPSDLHRSDAERGAAIVAAMGVVDIGQSCVVHRGQALAIEGVFGTDWMLKTLADRPDDSHRGGVLVKSPKPGQDLRVDMPVIGPNTVTSAEANGLDGIVIEAGGVMILDRAETRARADACGLFLWVRERSA